MMLKSFLSCFFLLTLLSAGLALEPKEVFLLVNKKEPASQKIAEHYCKARKVPIENIIVLDLPTGEDISRKDYDEKIVKPVREALKEKKDEAKVLLAIYGVPLRVGGKEKSKEEAEELKKLEPEIKSIEEALKKSEEGIKKLETTKEPISEEIDHDKKLKSDLLTERKKLPRLIEKRMMLNHQESQAAVDSELMLLWWDDYNLTRWQINLMHFQVPAKAREGKPPMVMTCRLDGPSPELVTRLIDESIEVEKKGLEGKVYVDARGIKFTFTPGDIGYGYGGYDESMREMAELLEKQGKMTVVLDDKETLFKEGACTDCALYCGWYSHANFIDCCRFTKGAVAWHLASSEAVSLRRKDSKLWCPNLLEKGAVATLGPVAEPYTIGFPKPAEFFGFLATGKYTLVECYAKTIHFASWMTTLIGDPLYNPFAENPRLKIEEVKPSPKQGRFLLIEKD